MILESLALFMATGLAVFVAGIALSKLITGRRK